jgi:hypothetical protein
MASKSAGTGSILRRRVSAVILLFSILLSSLASDRFHIHSERPFDGGSQR